MLETFQPLLPAAVDWHVLLLCDEGPVVPAAFDLCLRDCLLMCGVQFGSMFIVWTLLHVYHLVSLDIFTSTKVLLE